MKQLNHPSVVNLISDIIDRIPETSSGTYNKQDPTAYSRGCIKVDGFDLNYHDCTWGN